ncbi:hypothetical protein PSTG_19285, partial [Puccinia striiformis f. sp. tritici PST-78]
LNNLDLLKQKAYVNSEWVDSTTSRTFTVNDPATGEEIGTCPDMNVEDLHQAILAAKHHSQNQEYYSPRPTRNSEEV